MGECVLWVCWQLERSLALLAPLRVWCLPQKVGTGLLNPQQDEGLFLPISGIGCSWGQEPLPELRVTFRFKEKISVHH